MKTILCTSLVLLFITSGANAQNNAKKEGEYRRSSLCSYLIDEGGEMPQVNLIKQAFHSAPIPIKYNEHNVDERIFAVEADKLTDEERAEYLEHKNKYGIKTKTKGILKELMELAMEQAAGGNSVFVDSQSKADIEAATYHYLLKKKIAKQLFDKWFIGEDGTFSDAMVRERGLFDASAHDILTAKQTLAGIDLLATTGEDLVSNTFVVVSRFRYMSKDEILEEVQRYTDLLAKLLKDAGLGALSMIAKPTGKLVLGEGYYVVITSHLYQLIWDENVKGELYSMWDNKDQYDAADFFQLKYVGSERARAGVRASVFSNKPEEELIRIATINSTDAVLAKLEKKYEVFRTKTPLVINEKGELTAHIGTKEDLKAGDKFEVLEPVQNEKTQKFEYKKVGEIKVAKGKIWDNIYMATDDENSTTDKKGLTATVFEGNAKKFFASMVIRQID